MWRYATFVVTGCLLTVGLLWWAVDSLFPDNAKPGAEPPPPSDAKPLGQTPKVFTTVSPTPSSAQVLYDPIHIVDCTLSPIQEQDVASQIEGHLQRIEVDLGQVVRRDDLLGRLDDSRLRPMMELQKMKAESQLAELIAKTNHDEAAARVQDMAKARRDLLKAVSDFEYRQGVFQRDRYELEMKKAAEERKAAELELKKIEREIELHELRSDLIGEIVKVYKRRGEQVRPQEAVFRVANFDRLRVEGFCTAQQAESIRVGMRALVEPELRSRPITELRGHTAPITALAVSHDGRWLASASEDHTILLWNWRVGVRHAMLRHPGEVHAVAFSSANCSAHRLLAGCADGRARIWSISSSGDVGEEPMELADGHQGTIRAVAFSPDGKWCGTGGEDKRICLWELPSGRRLQVKVGTDSRATAHRGAVTAVHFTPDGYLISAGRDNTLKVWKWGEDSVELVSEFPGRSGDVALPGVSADGKWLLFDHGEELRILDRDTGTSVGRLENEGHGHFQGLALFSPTGKQLLTASANGRAQLWKVPCTPEESLFFRQAYQGGFSRNSLLALGMLTPSCDITAASLAMSAGPQPRIPAAPSAKDSEALFVPELWGLNGHELRHLVTRDATVVTCGAFAPHESAIFTGGTDQVVRVWAVPPADELSQPLEAEITYVGSQIVESGTGSVQIRAEMINPRDPSRRLRPGTRVNLTLYPETAPKP